jgi:hypothetical protein
MEVVLIILVVVVVIGIVIALALNPIVRKASDQAITVCHERLGRDTILAIEPRAVGFATDPEDAGGLRGQGCLAVNDKELLFVTTAGRKEFAIPRSAITSVESSGDPRSRVNSTLMVTYTGEGGETVQAGWRLPDMPDWLTALDYDWGPEGPPPPEDEDEDEEAGAE